MKVCLMVVIAVATLFALAFIHELLILAIASAFSLLSEAFWLREILSALPLNQTYLRLAVTTLSEIHPNGLAVNGPLGEFLNTAIPSLFVKPNLAMSSAWVSTIFAPGSTPLARFTTQAVVETVVMIAGTVLLRYGFQKKSFLTAGWGFFIQVQALVIMLGLTLKPSLFEEMGIGFLVGPAVEGHREFYKSLLIGVLPISTVVVFTTVGFTPLVLAGGITRFQKANAFALTVAASGLWSIASLAPYMGIAQGEIKSLALVTNMAKTDTAPPQIEARVMIPQVTPTATSQTKVPVAIRIKPEGPRFITIQSTLSGDKLFVDGVPFTIRGVQYYFGDLVKRSPEEKEKTLRRDFSIIKEVGFNAIAGWEEDGFDDQLFRLAHEYELGVVKPLSLQPKSISNNVLIIGDFLDPNFKTKAKQDLVQRIERLKNSPAILFWNIGADESLGKMMYNYRRSSEQLQGAADLIVELAVLAHKIDPAHPIIVSEPQDIPMGFYEEAIKKVRASGADPGSYFVYGSNFYAPFSLKADLRRIKASTRSLGVGFAVMEWAPFGTTQAERPLFRSKMAKDVADATPISVAYVFNPASDPMANMPDPTIAIVTGLAMTDMDRRDTNGLLAAVAASQEKPLFSTALEILKADSERGFSGIPLSSPIPTDKGVEQYFASTKTGRKLIAYRWTVSDKTTLPVGPEAVNEVLAGEGSQIYFLGGVFLQSYLELGGPAKFGVPISGEYQTTNNNGQLAIRQDFSAGWSLIAPYE